MCLPDLQSLLKNQQSNICRWLETPRRDCDITKLRLRIMIMFSYTAGCRYNAAQYNMIFHTALQWLKQNMNHSLNSQQTPHSSPLRASYGVSIVGIFEKYWSRYNGTVLYVLSQTYLHIRHGDLGTMAGCHLDAVMAHTDGSTGLLAVTTRVALQYKHNVRWRIST